MIAGRSAGTLDWPAWSLFAILFCWQMPHFFAIAWMYREDTRAPVSACSSSRDLDGRRAAAKRPLRCAAGGRECTARVDGTRLAISLLAEVGVAVAFLASHSVSQQRRRRSGPTALFASIIYLPCCCAVGSYEIMNATAVARASHIVFPRTVRGTSR
jgi:protoheme IX farnesyltransferase